MFEFKFYLRLCSRIGHDRAFVGKIGLPATGEKPCPANRITFYPTNAKAFIFQGKLKINITYAFSHFLIATYLRHSQQKAATN